MRISFVRTVGSPDRVYVVRDDGSEVSWSYPSYGEAVPHDLVHYVVERAFGIRRAFWGAVAAGGDPKRVSEAANREGGGFRAFAALGVDLDELARAEALANGGWKETPEAGAVGAELAALGARWRQLVPKGAIDVSWP